MTTVKYRTEVTKAVPDC